MFAMGWAATKIWTTKGSESPSRLNLFKAIASAPLALLPPIVPAKAPAGDATTQAAPVVVGGNQCLVTEVDPPLVSSQPAENDDSAPLVAGLSSLLACRVASADVSELPPWRRSCFHSKGSVDMDLSDYVAHVHWFSECSTPCLVLALIYLDRALARDTQLTLSAETCQRLFFTSLVAAMKYHDDDWSHYPNAFYADIGRIGVEDLNAMEKQFCKSIDWQFYVRHEEYINYHSLITNAMPAVLAA